MRTLVSCHSDSNLSLRAFSDLICLSLYLRLSSFYCFLSFSLLFLSADDASNKYMMDLTSLYKSDGVEIAISFNSFVREPTFAVSRTLFCFLRNASENAFKPCHLGLLLTFTPFSNPSPSVPQDIVDIYGYDSYPQNFDCKTKLRIQPQCMRTDSEESD